MKLQTHQSAQITEVRELAKRFDADAIEQCMDLALCGQHNACYQASSSEDVINVLAKVSFVSAQVQQGTTLAVAMRELGKRMRALQGE